MIQISYVKDLRAAQFSNYLPPAARLGFISTGG
jgi:hypothetical protein